ncbi:hypothetical protein KI659_17915 [Litoribacter alkaliphilus]|uniref:Uncharacterized protein n=1 Tax=Litoribacter ruber TaxID=702568 RepID=A0AAP2CKN2_9BACT|nr:hypothetical protein [Litoribacter alkaliphilus]MBS9525902.1 hypothetical protein [Litoribacter alkaliphilus]
MTLRCQRFFLSFAEAIELIRNPKIKPKRKRVARFKRGVVFLLSSYPKVGKEKFFEILQGIVSHIDSIRKHLSRHLPQGRLEVNGACLQILLLSIVILIMKTFILSQNQNITPNTPTIHTKLWDFTNPAKNKEVFELLDEGVTFNKDMEFPEPYRADSFRFWFNKLSANWTKQLKEDLESFSEEERSEMQSECVEAFDNCKSILKLVSTSTLLTVSNKDNIDQIGLKTVVQNWSDTNGRILSKLEDLLYNGAEPKPHEEEIFLEVKKYYIGRYFNYIGLENKFLNPFHAREIINEVINSLEKAEAFKVMGLKESGSRRIYKNEEREPFSDSEIEALISYINEVKLVIYGMPVTIR